MLIEFDCPHCNITLQVSTEFAGKAYTCANCGKEITIPKTNEPEGVTTENNEHPSKDKQGEHAEAERQDSDAS